MKWLLGLLCLIFLIVFHEFGHFIAAKIFGVKVESFSVGFGPILLHKTIKGTDYRLSLLPLGGYCGMKGEKDFQQAIDENLPEIKADSDSLYGIHPIKRALIGFAGPFFNLIFAFIAYSLISGIGYEYYTYSNSIIVNDKTIETSSVAYNAGLQTGDKIISINNKEISDFSDIIAEISTRPDEDISLKIDRNGEIIPVKLHTELNKKTGAGRIGISADTENLITKHTPEYNFFESIGHGFIETFNSVGITLKSLKILFKGVELSSAVSGPARVTDILGSTVQESFSAGIKVGIISTLNLLAIISISLFIMNLLPVPVLDGGLILIAIIETIFRKKINPKTQYKLQFVGLAFILVLFVIGVIGDFSFFINKFSLSGR